MNDKKKVRYLCVRGLTSATFLGYKYYLELYIKSKLANKTGSRPDPDVYYKRLDAGITTVIGYKTKFSSKRNFTIQALYNFGLLDISKAAEFRTV